MNIPPETKDWTWVLEEQCPECGFDSREPARADLASLFGVVGDRWVSAISGFENAAERPDPLVWSPLEYACHVRDVFALGRYRTGLMVDQEDPVFANWDQDTTAVEDDYASQDLEAVSSQLAENASVLGDYLDSVTDADWSRPGRRSDGARFTVESFSRYVLHDPIHHLTDVTGRRWT